MITYLSVKVYMFACIARVSGSPVSCLGLVALLNWRVLRDVVRKNVKM